MRTPSLPTALTLAAVLTLATLPGPARAESASEPPVSEPPVSEQLEALIRGLVDRVEPALESLRDTFRVFERIDSLEHYEEPEVLPNGDIIIRRNPDAPAFEDAPEPPESDVPESDVPEVRT